MANTNGSPIKHVIVIIGENRSFDHVFATYVPKRPEEKVVNNLLSKGIIKLDANKNAIPGPNFEKAHQLAAKDIGTDRCVPAQPAEAAVPQRSAAGSAGGRSQGLLHPQRVRQHADRAAARRAWRWRKQSETGLEPDYYQYLLTGGTGQTSQDARPAHHQRQRAAGRTVSADQRQHLPL